MAPDAAPSAGPPAPPTPPLLRLLLGPLLREPAELREALWATLREVPVLLAMELFWTAAIALLALRAGAGPWALAWLALEAACLPLRLGLGRACAETAGWRAARVAANLLRLVALALGSMASLWLGDLALTVLVPILDVGLLALVISRWVALPRLAAAMVYAVGAGLAAGLWGAPLPGLRLAAVMVPVGALAFHLLLRHNHALLLSVLRLQFENRHLSLHDPLTGLPNRRQFGEQLERLGRAQGLPGGGFALMCLDLDGFKAVNDGLGHEAGDRLLTEVAARLRQRLRACDTLCRLGGDEFVVLVPGADRAVAAEVAQRLLQAVATPFHLDAAVPAAAPVHVGLSLGIALCPAHACDGWLLFRQADDALYQAKRAGKGCYRWGGGAGSASSSPS